MDALRELALLESRDVMTERFERAHGRTPNATKCRQIAASLIQGRQYWDSAADAGDLVRPLLLYYGTLAFCRALIQFSRSNGGEETLSQSHGLQTVDWGSNFASRGVRAVLDFTARATSGTLIEVAEVARRVEQSRIYVGPYPSYVSFLRPVSDPKAMPGTIVSFHDLLKRVPELAPFYEQVMGQRSAAYPATPFLIGDSHFDLNVLTTQHGPVDWSSLNADIGAPDGVLMGGGAGQVFGVTMNTAYGRMAPTEVEWLYPQLAADTSDTVWIIGTIKPSQNWNQLTILFVLAYFLGMIVRYHPTIWLEINSQARGDIVLPLFREAREVVEEAIPKLIIQHFVMLVAQGAERTAQAPTGN